MVWEMLSRWVTNTSAAVGSGGTESHFPRQETKNSVEAIGASEYFKSSGTNVSWAEVRLLSCWRILLVG